jgi:hypothetical protein
MFTLTEDLLYDYIDSLGYKSVCPNVDILSMKNIYNKGFREFDFYLAHNGMCWCHVQPWQTHINIEKDGGKIINIKISDFRKFAINRVLK